MIRNSTISADRIAEDIAALSQITEPDRPYTRRAFSPEFDMGREWLRGSFLRAGLEVSTDAGGNLIGVRPGSEPDSGTILIGSHSDTVPDGGRYDGVAGVIVGLEIARGLAEAGLQLRHNLAVVDFLAEEVSVFGVSCIGSRAMTGRVPDGWLNRTYQDRSLRKALGDVGGDADGLGGVLVANPVAYLELHIEQGPLLESQQLDLGIVSAIAGIARVEVVISGRPDHAGTTPMALRADALVSAAALVTEVERRASALAAGPLHFTATVGEFEISPGAANVIPGQARMLIDIRSEDPADLDGFLDWLDHFDAGEGRTLTMRKLSDNPPVPMDATVARTLTAAAMAAGASCCRISSGAGHDAAFMAGVCPAGMVFVPCVNGRSHCPEEQASATDIALGARVMLNTILRLDGQEGRLPVQLTDVGDDRAAIATGSGIRRAQW